VPHHGGKIATMLSTRMTRGANTRRPQARLYQPSPGTDPSQRKMTKRRRNIIDRADVIRPHPHRCPEMTPMGSLAVVTGPRRRQGPCPEISTARPGLGIQTESRRSNSIRTPTARRSLLPIARHRRRRHPQFRLVSEEIQTTSTPAVIPAMPNRSALVMRSPQTLPTHRPAHQDGPDP
jgi:hypothetical protein